MSQLDEADTLPPSMDPAAGDGTVEPPGDFFGIMRRLGPGLIIAGSIVGSGELIATTKVGAQAGIALLWLIVLGCVIKVFVQVELGRYTISHGETTLAALNQVPGPRLALNWILWVWLAMMVLGIGQLGSIVGGVGQSMAISFPLKGDYVAAIAAPSFDEIKKYVDWDDDLHKYGGVKFAALSADRQERVRRGQQVLADGLAALGPAGAERVQKVRDELAARAGDPARNVNPIPDPTTYDDKLWAAAITLVTAILLYRGRYGLVQNLSTVLVASFTFVTIGNVIALQTTDAWHVSMTEYLHGLSFTLPESSEGINPLTTALQTFGIIGVGASELIAYPYWCMEKGYAKFTGRRTADESWARRSRGWLKVMRYDAFTSMLIYTIATLAFYITGAAVLHPEGRDPDGMRMVGTLAAMYVPVFGKYARWLFLVGAIAVLYSTFLAANAGNARMWVDCAKVVGVFDRHNQAKHDRAVAVLSVVLPFLCLAVFCSGVNPVRMILISGAMQTLLLPMIGFGALYLRWTRTDPRLRPTPIWDALHVVSCLGLLLAGVWGTYSQLKGPVQDVIQMIFGA